MSSLSSCRYDHEKYSEDVVHNAGTNWKNFGLIINSL